MENIVRPRANETEHATMADPSGARLLRRSPIRWGMDAEARLLRGGRRGGQVVWLNRRHPSGISEAHYRRLTEKDRHSGGWTQFVRDPELFARARSAIPITRPPCCTAGTA